VPEASSAGARLHRIITLQLTFQLFPRAPQPVQPVPRVELNQIFPNGTSHAPVIMSRRTLGGGRVLGTPSALASAPSPQPKPRVLSPTTSSVSLSSQASASQFSAETQDLTSRISLENGDTSISAAPAAPGAQLSCPICNEEMVRQHSPPPWTYSSHVDERLY
jgi:hypothetical protein